MCENGENRGRCFRSTSAVKVGIARTIGNKISINELEIVQDSRAFAQAVPSII
jgi:hypothetical protein